MKRPLGYLYRQFMCFQAGGFAGVGLFLAGAGFELGGTVSVC